MNPVLGTVFGLEIRWYSFLILVGVFLALILIIREGKRFSIPKNTMFDLGFYTILFGIIGARLYYVLFNWSYYQNHFEEILAVWNGGLAIHGGIIVGAFTMYLYAKKKKLNLIKLLDIASPALILAQAIGRWGNFFNSEAHGFATTYAYLKNLHFIPEFIIQGMYIENTYYIPTFYFESLWCLLGFLILIIIRRLKYIKNGTIISIYLMWYSIGRFFIEAWRTDSLMLGGFKIAQIISVILFLGAFVYLVFIYKKEKYENLYNDINLK